MSRSFRRQRNGCRTTGKDIFATEDQARVAAAALVRRRNAQGRPTNLYECPFCGKWHTTTHPRRSKRTININGEDVVPQPLDHHPGIHGFAWAFGQMKTGRPVRREGWAPGEYASTDVTTFAGLPFLFRKNGARVQVWMPGLDDMFAEDWLTHAGSAGPGRW